MEPFPTLDALRTRGISRILVVGGCGAGKSVAAREMSTRLGVPLASLDDLYWRAGWCHPTPAEWDEALATCLAAPSWILDGNYASSLPLRLERAELVVYLDFALRVRLGRAVGRELARIAGDRSTLPRVIQLAVDQPTTSGRLSFFREIVLFDRRGRRAIEALLDTTRVPVVRFRHPQELAEFLR
jgi:adenylate kinase family enzyme